MSETLTDLLPDREATASIRAAMARLDRRRDEVIERRDVAERERLNALRTPSLGLKTVLAAEAARHAATIDLDRLALLRHDLSSRLQVAVDRERVDAQEAEIAAARLDYQAAADAFRGGLEVYKQAAEAITQVLHLEKAQQQARERYRSAVLAVVPVGGMPPPNPTAGVDAVNLGLGKQVVLPDVVAGDFIWKVRPPPVNPAAHRFLVEAEIYKQK